MRADLCRYTSQTAAYAVASAASGSSLPGDVWRGSVVQYNDWTAMIARPITATLANIGA